MHPKENLSKVVNKRQTSIYAIAQSSDLSQIVQ